MDLDDHKYMKRRKLGNQMIFDDRKYKLNTKLGIQTVFNDHKHKKNRKTVTQKDCFFKNSYLLLSNRNFPLRGKLDLYDTPGTLPIPSHRICYKTEKGMSNLYYIPHVYPCPYYIYFPMYNGDSRLMRSWTFADEIEYAKLHGYASPTNENRLKDYGNNPFVINIEEAAKRNNTFRTAIWTGEHLQVTLMSIDVGEDVGLEVHPNTDQFLRIEEGQGVVQMGDTKDDLSFERYVYNNDAIMVPAGKWHNLVNTGNKPLKLYSIYAPPEHPFGTIHQTKADDIEHEKHGQ